MFNVPTHALVEADDLAYSLVVGADDSDDLFDLVQAIDQHVGDWEFSERLFRYFRLVHTAYKEIVKEDNL